MSVPYIFDELALCVKDVLLSFVFPSVAILAQDSIGFSCKLVPLCDVWSPALFFLSAGLFEGQSE